MDWKQQKAKAMGSAGTFITTDGIEHPITKAYESDELAVEFIHTMVVQDYHSLKAVKGMYDIVRSPKYKNLSITEAVSFCIERIMERKE